MSNMTVNDRNQMDRAMVRDESLGRLSERGRRAVSTYVGISLVVLGVLVFAAAQVFDGWPHLIVIGDLVVVFFGLAAWVYPERRHV